MSWFRVSSAIFLVWGLAFFALPRISNDIFGVEYENNLHAEDWTRLLGLAFFSVAFLLNEAHRSASREVRQTIARGTLVLTFSCALVMTLWQIMPDGRWNRLDLINVAPLYGMSYGLLIESGMFRRAKTGPDEPSSPPVPAK